MMRRLEEHSMEKTPGKVIHAARIQGEGGRVRYLLLRQCGDQHFCWFEHNSKEGDKETSVAAQTIEDALRIARPHWRRHSFRMVNCGFRYTLPERDECGLNALFHQMVASYTSSNGIYFDADLGNNCFINFASEEARKLWKILKEENKL